MMKLLIDEYEINDAGLRKGDIYVTHYDAFDIITIKGEDFTILYSQIPIKLLSPSVIDEIREQNGLIEGDEISELEVWWSRTEQGGSTMIYHSNPEYCPDERKPFHTIFKTEETIQEEKSTVDVAQIENAVDGLENFPLTALQQSLINYLRANVEDIADALSD